MQEQWKIDYGSRTGWGNGEQEYYRTQNTEVSGGFLKINIKKETFKNAQYTSSRLKTRGLQRFAPNMGPAGIRVEARIKLPQGAPVCSFPCLNPAAILGQIPGG